MLFRSIERAIYHECGHYEWHSMFFELQELHSADLKLLEYQEADKAHAVRQTPLGVWDTKLGMLTHT